MPLNEREVRRAIETALGIRQVHTQELQTTGFLNLRGQPFRFSDVLNPMVLVASDGTVRFSANAAGRMPTTDQFAATDIITQLADTTSTAGNAGATVLPAGDVDACEVWGFVYSYLCDGNPAARTTIPPSMNSLYQNSYAAGIANSLAGYITSSTAALAATQDAVIALGPGGVESNNLNGTLTFVASRLGLPLRTIGRPGITISAATNGLAGDVHRGVILGRVVA